MELAQHSQEVQPLEEQQPELAAGAQSEQPQAAGAQPEPTRHLAAVPTLEETAQQDAEPRAAPPPRRPPPRARPQEDEPRGAQAGTADGAPEQRQADPAQQASRDQASRYRRRFSAARTADERAAAIRYGAERGVPEAVELLRLLQAAQPEATPKAQEPQAAKAAESQPAQAAAAPAQQAPQAAAGAAPAQQPPAEPKHMGQSRAALAAHAEQGKWLADLAEGLGKMVGWEAPPSEPMDLFEGVPGFESIKGVKGNPRKRLAELVTVELASMSAKAGGEQDSPMKRRMEIGMLVVGTAGPGLAPFAFKLLGGGLGKLAQVSQVLAGVVRRWRR